MSQENRSVIIIGAGLVGSMAACFMAKSGFRVTLYEKRRDARKVEANSGKSINLAISNRARNALRFVGLERTVLENSISMKGRLLHDLSGKCKFVPYDNRGKDCLYSISRNLLNRIILAAVEDNPKVEVLFDHQLIDADLVTGVTIKNLITQKIFQANSDLIIGADGAYSSLRTVMQQSSRFNFSQTFIDHGYMEFSIIAPRAKTMTPNCLHIWPRNDLMMIALPNCDETWTVTLFMPFKHFQDLNNEDSVLDFFITTFPDIVSLLGGEKQLAVDCMKLKPRSLITVSCEPYHFGDKIVLIGDAAHAMVPFYGQGLNAGFEDCYIFREILERNENNVAASIKEFTDKRTEDAHAICELALYNYEEMRDLVTKRSFLVRKRIDDLLYSICPKSWIPLYTSVTFTDIGYGQCLKNRNWQNKVLKNAQIIIFIILGFMVGISSWCIFLH